MQILIPMAGAGSRFRDQGWALPKPLIDVNGRSMISRVIDNLGHDHSYVFVVQRHSWQAHQQLFEQAVAACAHSTVEFVDTLTRGAAETCLMASKNLRMDQPLLIANCDQIMDWSAPHFDNWFNTTDCDGTIVTFYSNSIKNSYVRIDHNGRVLEAREKEVISNLATTGVYVWKQAHHFVDAAAQMIERNIRTNNEFYVCPVFNFNIAQNHHINTYHINRHWPIGTPEDLLLYLDHLQKSH